MRPCKFRLKQKFDRHPSGRAIARLPNPVTAVARCERPWAQRIDQQILPNDKADTARLIKGIMSPSNRCSVKSLVNHLGIVD